MENKVILDSDFLYGLFVEGDPHHSICLNLLPRIESSTLIVCNLVIYEMLTLLSRRISQTASKTFLEDMATFSIHTVFVDKNLESKIILEFQSYKNKNISFVDCSNLYLAKKMNLRIASFDQFYPSELLIN